MWLSFPLALFVSMSLSVLLAGLDLGSIPFTNGSMSTLFFLFVVPPGIAVSLTARFKRRGLVRWTLAGFAAIALSPALPFLPLTVLLTLLLAAPIPFRLPEKQLEAQEDPRIMRRLASVREDLWTLYQQVEDRYMHRDYQTLVGLPEMVQPATERIEGLGGQKSLRGRNIRVHLKTALEDLTIVGGEASAVVAAISDSANLATLAAQGAAMPAKSKIEKELARRVRRIEQLLNVAKVQIGVAGGILEALGYSMADDSADSVGPLALQPIAADVEDEQPTRGAVASRPRKRSVRRRRH